MNLKVKRKIVEPAIISIIIFFFSVNISPYYINGDQTNYRLYYEIASSYSKFNQESFDDYRNLTGSSELGYYILVMIFSKFLNKDVFIALSNSIFSFALYCFIIRLNVNKLVAFFLIFDYYVVVNYFAAERLKFGMLMILISALTNGRIKYFLWFTAGLTHIQSLFILACTWFKNIALEIRDVLIYKKITKSGNIFIYSIISVGLLFFVSEHALVKFNAYNEMSKGATETIKGFIFTFATFAYAKNKNFEAIAMHSLILIATFMLGSDRMTSFSAILFLYFALSYKNGVNYGVLIYLIYSLYKSATFILNIIYNGNGYFKG